MVDNPQAARAASAALSPATLHRLRANPSALTGLRRGVEKESLRVTPAGALSTRPHATTLGSPLTHPSITTDFCEAQLELITGVHSSAADCLQELSDVHRFVHAQLGEELMWPSSMPCIVPDDAQIPVGRYGSSNIGRTKTIYRLGLGLRYGRLMQTISGIHYNFSVPEALWQALDVKTQAQRTAAYFGLIRNFRRWSWLLIYLFGASPAVCRSFTRHLTHTLQPLDKGSQYLPFATSLRMGPLGYQSSAQSSLNISYNSLADYTASMITALTTDYPAYAHAGVKPAGEYQQLNTAVLQIENEFYGTIRPKRTSHSGERPVAALRERGVEYVEVRCLDLNPFLPNGIDTAQMHFLDTFLLVCLLTDSGPDSPAEFARMASNQLAVVEQGRDPALHLLDDSGQSVSLPAWGQQLLDQCATLATLLDQTVDDRAFTSATEAQREKLLDPELTPSALILRCMREQNVPFFRFSMDQGLAHQVYFRNQPLSGDEQQHFEQIAADSLAAQAAIEAADTLAFDDFLAQYLTIPAAPEA